MSIQLKFARSIKHGSTLNHVNSSYSVLFAFIPPSLEPPSIFAKRELLAGSRTKVDDALSHLLSGCNNSSPNDNICRNKQVYRRSERASLT